MEKKSNNTLFKFLKGSAILVVSNVILKAINFFLLPLYTKHLTPTQLGITDTITNITSFVFPLLVMGLDSAFSAFYYDDSEDEELHRNKVFNTVFFTLLLTGIIPIILMLFSKDLSLYLFKTKEYSLAIILSLSSITMNLWYLPYALSLRIQNKMATFSFVNITASFALVMLNIAFVGYFKLGAYALILSTMLVNLLQIVLYTLLSKNKLSISFIDKGLLKRMLIFSLPLIPTAVASWVLNLSDRYMLLMYNGEAAVGIYGIGARFGNVLSMITSGVYLAYTAFAFEVNKEEDSKFQYKRILNVFFYIMIGICFTISLFGKEIIELMTTKEYFVAYRLLACLIFSQLLYGIYTIVSYGIVFKKQSKFAFVSIATGAVLNVVLNLIYIPLYGANAAAATTLVGFLVLTTLGYYFSNKLYPCDYGIVRIALTSIILFSLSILFMDASLLIKIVLWMVTALTVSIVFKDVIQAILKLVSVLTSRFR